MYLSTSSAQLHLGPTCVFTLNTSHSHHSQAQYKVHTVTKSFLASCRSASSLKKYRVFRSFSAVGLFHSNAAWPEKRDLFS